MEIWPKFILVEDAKGYWKTMDRIARDNQVTLNPFGSGREAFESFEKFSHVYSGIIVDYNCPIEKDGDPTIHLLDWLGKRVFGVDPSMPIVVLSGNEKAKGGKELTPISFYTKDKDEELCIQDLKEKAKGLTISRLKSKYDAVFEIFQPKNNFLGPDSEKLLILCIENMDETDPLKISTNMIRFRELLTNIFSAIYSKTQNIIPKGLVNSEGVDILAIIYHFLNTGVTGSYPHPKKPEKQIWSVPDQQSILIHRVTSMCAAHKKGFHDNDTNIYNREFEPTMYTYQNVLFAMIDYLIWFKGWMDKNK